MRCASSSWCARTTWTSRVGRLVYTLFLNRRGGIENDGTVTRLAEDRFLVITPTATQHRTLGWLRADADGMAVSIADVTTAFATIAVMGPRSRELLGRLTAADLSNEGFPFFSAQEIQVGSAPVRAIRASFVGELGWELYVPSEFAVHVYDAIVEAGRGPRPPTRRLPRARLAPDREGVRPRRPRRRPDRRPVHGRTRTRREAGEGLRRRRGGSSREGDAGTASPREPGARDPEPVLLHGESVIADGRIVGAVMSAAYAHTIGAAVGLAMVEAVRRCRTGDDRSQVDVAGDGGESDALRPSALRPERFSDACLTRSSLDDVPPHQVALRRRVVAFVLVLLVVVAGFFLWPSQDAAPVRSDPRREHDRALRGARQLPRLGPGRLRRPRPSGGRWNGCRASTRPWWSPATPCGSARPRTPTGW